MLTKYYSATDEGAGGEQPTVQRMSMDEVNRLFAEPEPTSDDTTNPPAETVPAETPAETIPPAETETPSPSETRAEQPAADLPNDPPVSVTPEPKNDPAPISWQDSIKDVDRTEILRQLGFDEFDIGFLTYRQEHGDVTPFLEAKVKDWDKVPAEDLLRQQLRAEYAALPEEDFDILFRDELESRYKLADHFTEQEQKIGAIRLKNDAEKIRATLKAEQAKFQIPSKDLTAAQREAQAAEAQKKAEQDRQVAALVEAIKTSPVIQKLQQERKVSVKAGDATVNFNVDPQTILDASLDINKVFNGAYDQNGQVTPEWAETLAFHFNREAFKKALVDQGKALGAKDEVTPLVNPSSQTPKPADTPVQSIFKAFATQGREMRGSDFFK